MTDPNFWALLFPAILELIKALRNPKVREHAIKLKAGTTSEEKLNAAKEMANLMYPPA